MEYGYINDIPVNTDNGSPYDRGAADSYYQRPRDPHYYPEGTYKGPRIGLGELYPFEVDEYHAGYDWNESYGDRKVY